MIPIYHGFILSVIIFSIGLLGVIIRRNLFFVLLSIEIMINASVLLFVLSGNYWCQADGQILHIIVITSASVEVSVGLSLMFRIWKNYGTFRIDKIM